ncbi:hypothetical protein MRB53_017304 [Persea americana]|uniref:Uncharacterized protein n=1 Tax=Persea americana TaxID=3435 RepID=A0ACC2M4N9_PERAE|nr:hypothetical protein MRB53_017304 [Persea americana]
MQTIHDSLPRKTTGTENPGPDSPNAALAATPDSGKTRNQCPYLQIGCWTITVAEEQDQQVRIFKPELAETRLQRIWIRPLPEKKTSSLSLPSSSPKQEKRITPATSPKPHVELPLRHRQRGRRRRDVSSSCSGTGE